MECPVNQFIQGDILTLSAIGEMVCHESRNVNYRVLRPIAAGKTALALMIGQCPINLIGTRAIKAQALSI